MLSERSPNAITPSTAVVTGGAGAIGSRLVRRLLDDGLQQVIVIDNFSSGYDWLLPSDSRLRCVNDDVGNVVRLPLPDADTLVFHLAAFFANENSVDHPVDDLTTNGLGTLAALLWAASGPAARFVYASAGCSIAGHGVDSPIREDMPVSLHMDTPYQITKALGELYCNYFNQTLPTVRCRFFNSYGPGEVPGRYRNVIPNFIWCALHNEALTITGTGTETRDFIFVDDLVDGLVRAAASEDAVGLAVNLGTGIQTDIDGLARLVIETCDSKSLIRYATRRPWDHSLRREADTSRASQVLDFRPKIGLEEGVAATVRWFTDNYDSIALAIKERR